MPNFVHYDYNQSTTIVINYLDQLHSGTFEHALHHLVENKLDLSSFYLRYQNDKTGRPAYDPAILLKIILFAYSKGIKSSRDIQWCCETNIIFKALSCDTVPHWTSIAKIISGRTEEIEELFEQILLVCFDQGLIGNELFAIDGCKMPSNAAKEKSGTIKELTKKREKIKRLIQHHIHAHKERDALGSNDDERKQRHQQTIKTLDKAYQQIDEFLKHASPRMGQGKRPIEVKSNITDNESAKMKTSKGTIQGYNGIATSDKKHQIIIDAQAFGEGQEQHTFQPIVEKIKERFRRLGISNDIYKDGVIVTADTGFANESNMQYIHDQIIAGYIPDNQFRSRDPKFSDQKTKYGKRNQQGNRKSKHNQFPTSEFLFNPVKKTCVCPAGEEMMHLKDRIDPYGNPKIYFKGRLRTCRHCSLKTQCMRKPESANTRYGHGRQVSFILDSQRKPNATDWMKLRIDSDKGKEIYGHRMSVIEPVFGNIGTNKGLNKFSLRGKDKVQGQWQLYCMVHNIEKIANYGTIG